MSSIENLKILYVEDDAFAREEMQHFLRDKVKKVFLAADGREGVESFEFRMPDIVIADILMPVMDGISATKEIRALNRPDAAEIPIIAITANAYSDDVDLVKSSGMNEHLSKPIDAQALIKAVLHYCKPSPLGRESELDKK